MNTTELHRCLESDPVLKQQCVGVYAVNKIPKPDGYPFAVIVNLDPDTMPGSHWISI